MYTGNPNTMFQFFHKFNQALQLIKRTGYSMPINKPKIKVIHFARQTMYFICLLIYLWASIKNNINAKSWLTSA